jgi:hypothetical protein
LSDEAVRADIVSRLEYPGGDSDTEESLVRVLVHLPEGVRTFALERCSFVSASSGGPQPAASSDRVSVVIEEGLDESAIKRAVAHAWLDQDTGGSDSAVAVEADAIRELVAQWEFTGPGADA